MLHLLNVYYDYTNNMIYLKGFDDESQAFVNGFEADYPEGRVLSRKESPMEAILETIQALEGENDQYYEVVSISENKGVLPKKPVLATVWSVWYRNKN